MPSDRISSEGSESISESRLEKIELDAPVPASVLKDAELVTAKGNVVTKDGVLISTTGSASGVSDNPFADPQVKAFYVDLYEKAKYECRHVFDAEIEWTKDEEKRLVRKLDWHGMTVQIFY
jgi:hypothetical protein